MENKYYEADSQKIMEYCDRMNQFYRDAKGKKNTITICDTAEALNYMNDGVMPIYITTDMTTHKRKFVFYEDDIRTHFVMVGNLF